LVSRVSKTVTEVSNARRFRNIKVESRRGRERKSRRSKLAVVRTVARSRRRIKVVSMIGPGLTSGSNHHVTKRSVPRRVGSIDGSICVTSLWLRSESGKRIGDRTIPKGVRGDGAVSIIDLSPRSRGESVSRVDVGRLVQSMLVTSPVIQSY
jgi:hypothetical protein